MDEIEFRAKEKYGKNWIYGMLCHNWENKYCIQRINDTKPQVVVPVLKETIGQFTGKLDKNGKKIYVGDIIKCEIKQSNWDNSIFSSGIVVFKDCCFGMIDSLERFTPFYGYCNTSFEIIGDIYIMKCDDCGEIVEDIFELLEINKKVCLKCFEKNYLDKIMNKEKGEKKDATKKINTRRNN